MRQTAPLLIVPECSAPKCHHSGDHYTMIKCRSCGAWYCEEHMEAPDRGSRSGPGARVTGAPTVRRVDLGREGLAYNLGYCAACLDAAIARSPVDSSWLR